MLRDGGRCPNLVPDGDMACAECCDELSDRIMQGLRERIEALQSALRDANDLIYVAEKLAKSGEYAGACRRWQEAARKLLEPKSL